MLSMLFGEIFLRKYLWGGEFFLGGRVECSGAFFVITRSFTFPKRTFKFKAKIYNKFDTPQKENFANA